MDVLIGKMTTRVEPGGENDIQFDFPGFSGTTNTDSADDVHPLSSNSINSINGSTSTNDYYNGINGPRNSRISPTGTAASSRGPSPNSNRNSRGPSPNSNNHPRRGFKSMPLTCSAETSLRVQPGYSRPRRRDSLSPSRVLETGGVTVRDRRSPRDTTNDITNTTNLNLNDITNLNSTPSDIMITNSNVMSFHPLDFLEGNHRSDGPDSATDGIGGAADGLPGKGVSPAKGAPAKGPPAKGAPAKGAPAKGAPAKGAPAKGAPAAPGKGGPAVSAKGAPPPPPAVRPSQVDGGAYADAASQNFEDSLQKAILAAQAADDDPEHQRYSRTFNVSEMTRNYKS
jgi:hypothetical protein